MSNDSEIRWYHNSLTGEIDSYRESGSLTDFPRGVYLAYGDYLTTGFKTKQAAIDWSLEWSACEKCKGTSRGKPGDVCTRCGNILRGPRDGRKVST